MQIDVILKRNSPSQMSIIFIYAITNNNSINVNSPGFSVFNDANLFAICSSFGISYPSLSQNGVKIVVNCSALIDPVESVSASLNFDVINSIPASVKTGMTIVCDVFGEGYIDVVCCLLFGLLKNNFMKGAATTTTRNTILRSTNLYRETRKENTTQTSGDEKNAKAESV
jgi:hypothetical protein